MTLSRREYELIAAWTEKAQPLSGVYFRSVSYAYMKPETVLEGTGAATHGGRFASPGTPASTCRSQMLLPATRSPVESNDWVALPLSTSTSTLAWCLLFALT